jgi:hypothetical protein
MALHRDIFWIGRQWAVTGFGMQAINQKHNGQYDIPIDRLWDDDLRDGLRGQKWFNPDDFNKGLAIAQARHPKPPKPAPRPLPVETLSQATDTLAPATTRSADIAAAGYAALELPRAPEGIPMPYQLDLVGHPAKLLRVWRARRRR